MVTITSNSTDDVALKLVASLDDETKGLLQHLLRLLKASSHMHCVLQKR